MASQGSNNWRQSCGGVVAKRPLSPRRSPRPNSNAQTVIPAKAASATSSLPQRGRSARCEVPLPRCPHCGGPLRDRSVHEQIQVDLPEVNPRWPGLSPSSSAILSGSLRPAGAARVCLGPRAVALAADLKGQLGISEDLPAL